MKKYLLLLSVVLFGFNVLLAQDDDLPPPTSQPKEAPKTETKENEDFKGFKKPKKIDFSKFIIEPNFNFAIARGRIDLGLSPYVGYNIWKGLYAGAGITYFYTGFSGLQILDPITGSPIATTTAKFHTYGGGVFLQYNVWRGFFARAKLEVLHRTMDDWAAGAIKRPPPSQGYYFNKKEATVPALLLGAGYNMLQNKNFFFPILVSYNLLDAVTDKTYSLYPNGWVIQLGFVNVF